ncbi:MAG: ATP-binding protein [Myxococcales bacterium]|nr:ATP-binding protein [Myxococcales bacterium]
MTERGRPGGLLDTDFSAALPLRYRAFVVVVIVTLAPVVFVLVANYYERTLKQRLLAETAATAERALSVGEVRKPNMLTRALAEDGGARVRLLHPSLQVLAEHDEDRAYNRWDRLVAFVTDSAGARPLSAFDGELGPVAQRREVRRARADGHAQGCTILDQQRLLRCYTVRRLEGGQYIYVERSRPRGTRALYEQRHQVFKVTLFVLPGALLLAAWLSWRMVRPIERLRMQVQRQAQRSAPREDLPVERSDEFGELTTAFNELLRRLRDRSEENEAFVADLAHEFKNPVAAIRAAAERLEQGELSRERVERIARVLDQSSRRLDDLLSEFLELASADAGMRGEDRAPVALAEMVDALVAQLRADERFGSVRFETEFASNAQPALVERRVTSAIRNLLENAATYAGEQGQVRVRLQQRGDRLQLEVADSGPGIAPEDRSRVFDRFFTRREGGTGLGLALTRAVVEAHGGSVEARAAEPGEEPGGAVFVVQFPLAAA